MARPLLHSLLHVSKRRARRISLSVCISLICGTLVSSYFVYDHHRHDINEQVNLAASEVADRLELFMLQHVRALDRQALAWLDGGPVDERGYVTRTTPLLDVYPSFQAVNWVAMDRTIQYVAPIQGNLAALGADLSRHPVAAQFLDSVIATGELRATRPVDLLQGGRGFAVYQPVRARNGDIIGLLNGVFRISAIISEITLVNRTAWYEIRLSEGEDPLYESDPGSDLGLFAAQVQLKVADRVWDLTLYPGEAWLEAHQPTAVYWTLFFGMLTALSISGLFHLVLASRAHAGILPDRYLAEQATGVLVIDKQNRTVVDATESAARMIGFLQNDLRGVALLDVSAEHLPDGESAADKLGRLLHDTDAQTVWAFQNGDGAAYLVDLTSERALATDAYAAFTLKPADHPKGTAGRARNLATHDPITGLPNRALLTDRLSQAIATARRRGGSVAVMVVEINEPILFRDPDTPPDRDGMRLLRSIASRLRGGLAEMDSVGRLSGARFAVIAGDADHLVSAGQVAIRLHQSFHQPVDRGGENVRVKAAIGLSLYPSDTRSAEQLLSNAASALQRAKVDQTLPISFFSRPQTDALFTHFKDSRALADALHDDTLELIRVPRYTIRDGVVTGYGLGVRWLQPDGRVKDLAATIELAAHAGLLPQLTVWLIHAAQRAATDAAEITPPPVSLGMDAARLGNEEVYGALTLPPEDQALIGVPLEIDLRSGVLAALSESARGQLQRLRNQAIALNIEGLCDGIMHHGRLAEFGFRRMKISSDMINASLREKNQEQVLKAITTAARSLDIITVAVDLPEDADLQALSELGFDEFQPSQPE